MKRVLAIALPILLLLAGIWTAFWFWSVAQLETQLAGWKGDRDRHGLEIAYRGPDWSGFPFSLTARFTQPRIRQGDGLAWQGPTIAGSATPLTPLISRWLGPGRHRIEPPPGSGVQTIDLSAGALSGLLALTAEGRVERIELASADLQASEARLGAVSAEILDLAVGPLPSDGDRLSLPLSITARALSLPGSLAGDLPGLIDDLAAALHFEGPRPAGGSLQDLLSQWRGERGHVTVRHLWLRWAGVALRATGRLGLDAEQRPSGQLDLRATGIGRLADSLTAAGVISQNEALGLRLAAAGFQVEDPETGQTEVALPLVFKEGEAYLGPLRLGRLPAIVLPR